MDMTRMGVVLIALTLFACGNKKKAVSEEGFSFERFSEQFRQLSPPYALSDTGLLRNKDTATIRSAEFASFIPDSLKTKLFGKGVRLHYIAMARMNGSKGNSFYLVKLTGGSKKAALLVAFNKDEYGGALPFLVPDNDPSTSQLSSIDKSLSIVKSITQKKPDNSLAEGKDVYDYDPSLKQFALILTNPLNNENSEVINPIDTFARKHRFAGDYGRDKKNFVSVRDGRHPNQLLVFMHLEKNEGACTGELKGDVLLTSPSTAIYRQGGDPCVLSFRFTPSSVTVKEDEGCGSHRGVDCVFDGTFNRKKEARPKTSTKKK